MKGTIQELKTKQIKTYVKHDMNKRNPLAEVMRFSKGIQNTIDDLKETVEIQNKNIAELEDRIDELEKISKG